MKTKPDLTNGYYAVRGSRDFYKGTSFRCNVWSENTHYFHDENYVDFVVYDGTLLMCMRNHISSEDNQPILKREGTVAVGLERNPLWEFVIGGVYSNGSISGDQIKLKIDGETLYVSYNGGATWTKVGSVGSPAVEPPKYTASVASVSSGTTADASVNVVNNDFKFTFSIPRGTDGKDGKDGVDGANGKDGANGNDGIDGISKFKSTVFIRSNEKPDTPKGGSYENPKPTSVHDNKNWEDGIPEGKDILWASNYTFVSNGDYNNSDNIVWSNPVQMTDTSSFEVIYGIETANLTNLPDLPIKDGFSNENGWYDDVPSEEIIYMATATCSNGIWSNWAVSKIKGENGTNGTSINIKGKKDSSEELPMEGNTLGDAYLIDGNLWVWDGDSWQDAGQIQGPSGTSMYLWVKYCNVDPTNSINTNIELLDTPSKYIGICTTTNSTAPTNKDSYTWTKWQGDDGWGYQYIYKLSATNEPPTLPEGSPEKMDDLPNDGWFDNPLNVSEKQPYCWMCYSQSDENGGWSKWKGTSYGKPALWAKWGADGAPGKDGAGYQQCFCRSEVDTENFDDSGIELRPDGDKLNGWTTSAQGVSSSNPVEWRCDRVKLEGSDTWSDWSAPHVFSHFGKNGEDGAGLEYVFLNIDKDTPPAAIEYITGVAALQTPDYQPSYTYTDNLGKNYLCEWQDNQSEVSASKPYLYSSIRHKKNGEWQQFEKPILWNRYHRDGTDGQMALAIKVWKRGYPTLQTNDKPGAATYNLNEHTLTFTGSANGWSFDMPSHMSNSTLYSCSAYITGTITENITINEADWKGPNIESVDGKDGSGQSATYITVYPDSILVNVDDDGKARFDQTITGYANYYYGTGKLDSEVMISCANNKIVCSKGDNNSFTIAIPKDTVIGSNDFVTVTCTPDKSSVSSGGEDVTIFALSSTIPINKIASNDVYSLTVTPNQIIAPNSSDWSKDITCIVIKNGKECPASDKNVSVENLINGKSGTLNLDKGSTTHKYTYTVNNNNFDDLSNELTFVLKINDISVAHQTVSLIKNGTNGSDGNSVIGVYEYYLWTDKNTTPTGFTSSDVKIEGGTAKNIIVNGETWNANKPIEFNQLLPYLWNVEVIKIGNENASEYTVTSPSLISTSGRGIESITEYYLRCNTASGITHTDRPWETYDINKHVPTEDNKYLWNYEHIRYTDGTDHKTPPTIVTFWNKGADGRSIADVIEYYLYTNTAGTPTPDWDNYSVTLSEGGSSSGKLVNTDGTEWTQDAPPTDKGTYLWNVEVIVYKDSGDDYTHTSCILLSDRANEIKSIEEYYMIGKVGTDVTFNKDVAPKENWSGTDVEGETWYKVANTQFVPVPTNDYPYLWNAEKITYLGGTEEYTSPICLGVLLKGDAGDNSYNLSVELSEDMYSVVIDKESRFPVDTYSFDQIVSLYENGQETSISDIGWTNPQPDNIEIIEDTNYHENNKKKFNITIKNSCKFNRNSLTLSCTCKTSDNHRQASKNCTITALLESEGSPMIYPAGEWSSEKEYIVTGSTAPYVKYEGVFYVATKTPDDTLTPDESNCWITLDKFDAIYTDIIFAGKGQVGSVLFNGDWMYSQQGINVDDFHGGYTSISDIIGGKSQPNFAINCLTGEGYFSQGAFRWDNAGNIMTSGNMKALGDDLLYAETMRGLDGQRHVYTVYDLTKLVVVNRMSTTDTTLHMTAIIPEKLDSLFDVDKSYSCTAYFGAWLDIYPTPRWATEQSINASLHEIVFTRMEGLSEIDINGETFKYLNGTIKIY